jgi:tetratricopeptide (TPR) repeat protein
MAQAQENFERAAALNPNSAHVDTWYALFLSSQGRLDASLARFQKASELDPLWFINLLLYAWELPFARRFEKALEINDRAAALRSDVFIVQHSERARVLLALRRRDEAVVEARFIRAHPEISPRWHSDGVTVWVFEAGGAGPGGGGLCRGIVCALAAGFLPPGLRAHGARSLR